MSTDTQDMDFATKPLPEHEWLNKLVGEWRVETSMHMGDESMKGTGTEKVTNLGGLWAYCEGSGKMPDGSTMEYKAALGYDVSFKEYRYVWFASVSSHAWNYKGTLSEDKKTLTLDCEGPHMEKDGETANYRDVLTIIDEDNRTYTSSGQDENGEWVQYMKSHYHRIK